MRSLVTWQIKHPRFADNGSLCSTDTESPQLPYLLRCSVACRHLTLSSSDYGGVIVMHDTGAGILAAWQVIRHVRDVIKAAIIGLLLELQH